MSLLEEVSNQSGEEPASGRSGAGNRETGFPGGLGYRLAVGAFAALGLVWRLFHLCVAKRGAAPVGDELWYSMQAQALAEGHGFVHTVFGGQTALHPPLTLFVLAPAQWLAPGSVLAQRLVMTLLGCVSILLVARLARRLGGDRAGVLAAALAAGYAGFWMNDAVVMSEGPTTLVVCLVLLASIGYLDAPSGPRAALAGSLTGLVALARPELLLVAPLALVPLIVSRIGPRAWRRWLRDVALALAACLTLLAPWMLFNAARFRRPVLISTNLGPTDLGTNCRPAYYGAGVGCWHIECLSAAEPPPGLDESEISERWVRLASEFAAGHRGDLPRVTLARLGRQWNLFRPRDEIGRGQGEGRERWASRLGMWQFWLLAPLAAAGAFQLRRQRAVLVLFACLALVVSVGAARFEGLARRRVPVEVVVVCAAVALDAALRSFARRRVPVGLLVVAGGTVALGLAAGAGIRAAAESLVAPVEVFAEGRPRLLDVKPGEGDATLHALPAPSYDAEVIFERTSLNTGVAFRVQDPANGWRLVAVPGYGTWILVRVVNGVEEVVRNTGLSTVDGPVRVVLENRPASIRVLIDGIPALRLDDSTFGTATGFGLLWPPREALTPGEPRARVSSIQVVAGPGT